MFSRMQNNNTIITIITIIHVCSGVYLFFRPYARNLLGDDSPTPEYSDVFGFADNIKGICCQ